MTKPLRQTASPTAADVQDAVREHELSTRSKTVTLAASVGTTAKVLRHSLGRKPAGWRVIDIDADATVWRSAALNNDTLTLTASASANIRVEVF